MHIFLVSSCLRLKVDVIMMMMMMMMMMMTWMITEVIISI